MSDLISRQAALDALTEYWKGISDRHPTLDGEMAVYADCKGIIKRLSSAQPDVTDVNVGGINKFIDGLVEIFADIRESHVDDSVCGLCEFDGAYIGESGDWCNECPGFNRDDCFKLRDGIRKKWITEITACMPSSQPHWIPCSERLPEEDVEVLITYRYKEGEGDTSHADIDITTYGQMYFGGNKVGNHKHWRQPFEYFESNYEVVAWMPLPDPYKGEQNE